MFRQFWPVIQPHSHSMPPKRMLGLENNHGQVNFVVVSEEKVKIENFIKNLSALDDATASPKFRLIGNQIALSSQTLPANCAETCNDDQR